MAGVTEDIIVKKSFRSEIAYALGIILLALGTSLMELADFGMSMVVAPAYIIYLKVSQYYAFFTFGMAEYCLQLVLIILLSIVLKKLEKWYLFSFVTAVLYGMVLDFFMRLVSVLPSDAFYQRTILFAAGMLICAAGVAFFLHTRYAPEAYELIVKEISQKKKLDVVKVKTTYDISSLLVSVILSFIFFGFLTFKGVKLGTLVTALLNGWVIGKISSFLDKKFDAN